MAFDDKVVALPAHKGPLFGLPPSACNCGERTVVGLMTVVNTNTGRLMTGAASDFCTHDEKTGRIEDLKRHLQFRHWTSYCADCYVGNKTPGPRKYTDEQCRVAWKWFIGEMCSGSKSMGSLFKPIRLTDEQRDRAIEIVNYEAHRTGEPDAIPDEYKLAEFWA